MRTEFNEPQKFTFHDRVPEIAPIVPMYNRCKESKPLTRFEKDTFFSSIQYNGNGGYYKLSGWIFDFRQFMKRFVVKYRYDNHFTEIYAFDKMCIRNNVYTCSNIIEIYEIPKKY